MESPRATLTSVLDGAIHVEGVKKIPGSGAEWEGSFVVSLAFRSGSGRGSG
jgi:hypothetical protein